MSNLVHGLAFGTPKFYIAPYGKINYRLFNMSSNCDLKSGLGLDVLEFNLRPTRLYGYTYLHLFLPCFQRETIFVNFCFLTWNLLKMVLPLKGKNFLQ